MIPDFSGWYPKFEFLEGFVSGVRTHLSGVLLQDLGHGGEGREVFLGLKKQMGGFEKRVGMREREDSEVEG